MTSRTSKLQEMLEGFYKMKRHADMRKSCRTHGLSVTHAQWMVLNFIYREEHVSVKDICLAFGITSSAVTQLVNELVKNNYVAKETSTTDRRVSTIELTKKTSQTMSRVQKSILAHMLQVFSALTDQEFMEYARLNKKINNSLK